MDYKILLCLCAFCIFSIIANTQEIPLDPVHGGRCIDGRALQVGDIILSTTEAKISEVIRDFTKGPVSHAMLYVGDNMVVEAISVGVVKRSLGEAIADASVAVAFRHSHVSEVQGMMIADFAREQAKKGKKYNKWGIVRQALFRIDLAVWCSMPEGPEKQRCRNWVGRIDLGTADNRTFFCSQLVVAAYQAADISLTTDEPHWTSPNELAQLRFTILGYVGHLKTPMD